jgi:hypothetical protein
MAGGALRLSEFGFYRVARRKASRVESPGPRPGSFDSPGTVLYRIRDGQDGLREVGEPTVAGKAGTPIMADRTIRRKLGCKGTMTHQKVGFGVGARGRKTQSRIIGETRAAHGDVAGLATSGSREVTRSLRGVALQTGLRFRVGQVLEILGAAGLVAEGTSELVGHVGESKVRLPLFRLLPLHERSSVAIVTGGAD